MIRTFRLEAANYVDGVRRSGTVAAGCLFGNGPAVILNENTGEIRIVSSLDDLTRQHGSHIRWGREGVPKEIA